MPTSSKVIHVPNDIHHLAKSYCTAKKLCMSDWVSKLIREALQQVQPETALAAPEETAAANVLSLIAKKSGEGEEVQLPASEETSEKLPEYAYPPFWAKEAKGA